MSLRTSIRTGYQRQRMVCCLMAAWVVASEAQASDQLQPFPPDCVTDRSQAQPLPGTAGFGRALHALLGADALYGAVRTLENTIFPGLDRSGTGASDDGVSAVGYLGADYNMGASRLPLCNGQTGEIDIGAQRLALGLRFSITASDYVSFFYSMAIAGTTMVRDRGESQQTRVFQPIVMAFVPLFSVPILTLSGNTRTGRGGGSAGRADYVAGINLAKGLAITQLIASAGYVRSSGWYFNVRDTTFHLTFGTVLKQSFQQTAYLTLGVRDAPLFDTGLLLSLYGTRVSMVVPPVAANLVQVKWLLEHIDDQTYVLPTIDVATYNAEIKNIGTMFDASAVWAQKPTPYLQSAVVTWHTAGFHPTAQADKELNTEDAMLQSILRIAVSAGYVATPKMIYFGQERRQLIHAGASAGPFYASYNDPVISAQFPYVTNTFQVGVQFRAGM